MKGDIEPLRQAFVKFVMDVEINGYGWKEIDKIDRAINKLSSIIEAEE